VAKGPLLARSQTERDRAVEAKETWEGEMNWVPVIWSVWGATVLFMAVVSLYAARLGKNEEDQLFLSEASSHEKSEQAAIASRVDKVQPLKRTALVLLGAMTLVVVVYYAFDMIKQFK
jgi:hypothetical protein